MKRTLITLSLALGLSSAVLPVTPASAAPAAQFRFFQYNPAGSDTTTNASVNGEYIVIKNVGTRTMTMTGWTVRDNQSHVYKFGTFSLGAAKSVTLRTGKGTNTAITRYWGLGNHVWNNTLGDMKHDERA